MKPINKRLMVEVVARGKDEVTESGFILKHNNDQDEMEMVWSGIVVDYAGNCELQWEDSLGKTVWFDKRGAIESAPDSGLWFIEESTVFAIDMES